MRREIALPAATAAALLVTTLLSASAEPALAAGRGQMFESITVAGLTDVELSTDSGVLADFDHDGRTDILLIQSGCC